jgi:hypothetical protein
MPRIVLISLLTALFLFACEGKTGTPGRQRRIPDKDLPAVLADLYLADGLLALYPVKSMFPNMDSISGYAEVLKKHGYSIQQMDKTMKYYFMKKPKKLEKIYDRALAILTEIESNVEKEALLEETQVPNHWTGLPFYVVPDPTGADSVTFDIVLESAGTYNLSFTATVFPGDQLNLPSAIVYTCHRDSSLTGKRDYLPAVPYIKDGRPHVQSISISVSHDRPLRLKGSFYDISCSPEPWGKNAYFTDIILTYTVAAV